MAHEDKSAHEDKKVKIKLPKINVWMVFTLLLIIVIGVLLYRGTGTKSGTLTAQEAANKAVSWISNYFQANGQNISVTLVSTNDTGNGLYEFTVLMSSSQGNSTSTYYVSEDGNLFLPQAIDITQKIPQQQQPNQSTTIPKTDRPTVDLYVMAFCPYGIQAETTMKPVVDLLANKSDIKIHFIVSISGNTPDTVQSLHGTLEAQEDLRQVCIMKYYDQKTYWNYVMVIGNNCSNQRSDLAAYETCWKNAATNAGINASKISTCSNSSDGLDLLKADVQLTQQYGVSGSPTLIINGGTYNGDRTPEAFKQGICSAFITQPTECNQTLSSTGGSASGGCG